ncbi:MAG: SpoIIE family protein phosphatase [Stigonema ocellatum SAG 48.90 = DSM 106950]|nr:SpoIIE family protein phosphatase [Stigonema ocellatum SAG 48.90 = DSM 106950]
MKSDLVPDFRKLRLPTEEFTKLFPFHLVIDREMKIVEVGEVIQRIFKPIQILDSSLKECFSINRPKCPANFEAICQQTRSLFLLESHYKEMQFKGQMIYLEASDYLLFLGSPWITDIADLKKLGLSLNDFPLWDSVLDYLFLLQGKNAALADGKKLHEKLTVQRTELQATASRLRTLIESLQIGVLLEDETRHILLANQQFCHLFDIPMTPEALKGMDCRLVAKCNKELLAEPEEFIRYVDEVVTQRKIVLNKEWHLQNGRIFAQDYVPIVIDDKLYGHLWKYDDITLRKQSENIIRLSEERLKLALDAVNEGLWDWNLETGEVYRSPRWFTMLGYDPDELENNMKVSNKLIHPEDQSLMQQRLIAHLKGHTPFYEVEVRLLAKSGEWKWILNRGKLVSHDSQGKSLRMVGTHLDITERKKVEEELKKQYQRALVLKGITEKIRQSLQLDEILQITVKEVQQILSTDRVIIFRLNPDGSGRVVQEAVVPGCSPILDQDIYDPCLQEGYLEAYREGHITAICDLDKAGLKSCYVEFLSRLQVKANLVVPILVRDNLWGLLIAHQCNQPRQWTELELDLLKHLADQLGIGITQSQLLAQETRQAHRLYQTNQELQTLAEDLQTQKQLLEAELNEAADYVKSILPNPISGLITINSTFLPSSQLGGDCFDYYWLDEDNLVIYLLDVSGHGLAAALPSISVHNLLRAHSLPNASLYQPSEVLQNLNDIFSMDKHNARYFTIWYGVFNRSSYQLTYASAGHPPALLLSKSTEFGLEVQQLATPSLPIGVGAETKYYNAVCDIQALSKLYVFSDGVYEVEQSDGSMWNFNSFINLLMVCHQPHELDKLSLDSLLESIRSSTGTKIFTDDCSLIEINF